MESFETGPNAPRGASGTGRDQQQPQHASYEGAPAAVAAGPKNVRLQPQTQNFVAGGAQKSSDDEGPPGLPPAAATTSSFGWNKCSENDPERDDDIFNSDHEAYPDWVKRQRSRIPAGGFQKTTDIVQYNARMEEIRERNVARSVLGLLKWADDLRDLVLSADFEQLDLILQETDYTKKKKKNANKKSKEGTKEEGPKVAQEEIINRDAAPSSSSKGQPADNRQGGPQEEKGQEEENGLSNNPNINIPDSSSAASNFPSMPGSVTGSGRHTSNSSADGLLRRMLSTSYDRDTSGLRTDTSGATAKGIEFFSFFFAKGRILVLVFC